MKIKSCRNNGIISSKSIDTITIEIQIVFNVISENTTGFLNIFDQLMGKSSLQLDELFRGSSPGDTLYNEDTEEYDSSASSKSTLNQNVNIKSPLPLQSHPTPVSSITEPSSSTLPERRTLRTKERRKRKPTSSPIAQQTPPKRPCMDDNQTVPAGKQMPKVFRSKVVIKQLEKSKVKKKDKDSTKQSDTTSLSKPAHSKTVAKAEAETDSMAEPALSTSDAAVPSVTDSPNKAVAHSSDTKDSNMTDYMIKCENCDLRFENERKLKVHSAVHSDKIKCFMCIELFDVRADLEQHLDKVHNRPFVCYEQNCYHACQTTNGLKSHMRTTHGHNPKYNCDFCPRFFKTEAAKVNHSTKCEKQQPQQEQPKKEQPKKEEPQDNDDFQCLHCFEHMANRAELKLHLANDHNITKIVCTECHSEVEDSDALAVHNEEQICDSIVAKRKKSYRSKSTKGKK